MNFVLIFFDKDEVILDVFRGRRKEKHAKDTLTDSEHPFEAVPQKQRDNRLSAVASL